MGESHKPGRLEMGYDPERERREWVVQRVGWGIMFLLAAAALAGVLGGGPISNTQRGKVGDELYLEYDRYVRHQAPFALKVFCRPAGEKIFTLSLNRGFLERYEIKGIQPQPESTIITDSQCIYSFASSGTGEQLITFRFEADGFGRVQNEVTFNGRSSHKMEQFIWP